MPQRNVYYVLSSHWDREWYQTFQDYRYRLVTLLDDVLDGLGDGSLAGPFQMDGQALPIEDYLEVRPERREMVADYVQRGLLLLGPWYVLPDEFLVSGESMVRNLERGLAVSKALGGASSRTGFVCDIFGHNSQLPQIMAGFGIHTGFIWRGVNLPENRHVIWEGADGTEMVCYRFGRVGYCSFALQVRKAGQHLPRLTQEELNQTLNTFIEEQKAAADASPLLLFDGCDHQGWDKDCYTVIQERINAPDGDLRYMHSTLDAFASELYAQRERITTRVRGELREPAIYPGDVDSQWLIPGVLSSRVWIKQWNAACEAALCSWAEPFSLMASNWLDERYPQGYLNVAWDWLLKNHPHDSICGCSIDAVHRDMVYRFQQAEGIAERLTIEATRKIAANVRGEIAPNELRVCVFNAASTAQQEPVELALEIPAEWPTFNERFGFEPKPAFRIYGPDGQEIPYQRLSQTMGRQHMRIHYDRTPESYQSNNVGVCLPLDIPAAGYTTLTVRAGEQGLPTRHPETPELATSNSSLENAHLSVTVASNGTLTVTDKRSGKVYSNLMSYEDRADIGDGWYHGEAVNEQIFTSCACAADVALVQDGPYCATLRVRTRLNLPAALNFECMTREENWQSLVIDSRITLYANADHLEVETRVHNTIRDHRLCVLFDSGARAASEYEADSPFDVVRRSIALNPQRHTWREAEPETHPQRSWTAVCDEQGGLAILSTGLYEASVRDLPQRPIALTLYRSTQRTVGTNGEPDGELLQDLAFHYWIMPIQNIERNALCKSGQRLANGLRTAQLQWADMQDSPSEGNLAAKDSLYEAEGAGVITSVRIHQDAAEIRLFNPEDAVAEEILTLDERLLQGASVQLVDFEGNPVAGEVSVEGNVVRLTLRSHGIATLAVSKE